MTTSDVLELSSTGPHGQGSASGLSHSAWRFMDCPHRAGIALARDVSSRPVSPSGWLDASVPGLATADLLSAGRIPDPFWKDQLQAARFIEQRDFVYLVELHVDPALLKSKRRARLRFDSLDTFATIFLNGKRVGAHENQFRRCYVDISDALVPGENRLAIAFEASWPATVRRAGEPLPYWNEPWERLYVRKSQMSFGWDWAPRLPTVGIVGAAYLELGSGAFANDLWATGEPLRDGAGLISVHAEYHPHDSFTGEVSFLIDGELRVRENVAFHAGHAQTVGLSDTLSRAKLWSPRELGNPHLYRVELTLAREGQVIVSLAARTGIRQLKLERGEPGKRRFELSVNGQKLFCKGENWIPPDLLHTRLRDDELRAYLRLLMEGGVNLVRVWGGGIIERPAFYDACDELGLLVWQDFPYACGIYPRDDEFLSEAAREASDIVERLRSHPSIALWCGNNENEVLAEREAPDQRIHPLYYEVLAKVTQRLDPKRPYWPGSPASESPETPADSPNEGDRHNWDVWFHFQDHDMVPDDALFCSEFGAQGFPQRETLESMAPLDELWAPGAVSRAEGPSPGLLFARRGAQLEKLFARAYQYGNPNGLDAVIATTQAFQADVIGRMVEHYRRLPTSGGVIVWNYTSTWPGICWALVDWYRRPKQAFYAARRAFAPLVLGIEPEDETGLAYAVYVSSDRPGVLEGAVSVSLRDLTTGTIVEHRHADVGLSGPSCVKALRFELPAGSARSHHALVAELSSAGAPQAGVLRSVRYLSPARELALFLGEQRGGLSAEWSGASVRLVSKRWRTRVGIESFEPGVVWDDNYFDLLPGEERTLKLVLGEPKHLWVVADYGKRAALPFGKTVSL